MAVRREEITGYHRIHVSIWNDPDFTALSADAQLVYFMARCRNARQRFSYMHAKQISAAWTQGRFDDACAQLRSSNYGRVLDGRARRDIPLAVRREVMRRDKTCKSCGADDDLTLDHIHPYSKGGPDTVGNLQVLCRSCNARKGAKQ